MDEYQALEAAARAVLASWEGGDLADAVRGMSRALDAMPEAREMTEAGTCPHCGADFTTDEGTRVARLDWFGWESGPGHVHRTKTGPLVWVGDDESNDRATAYYTCSACCRRVTLPESVDSRWTFENLRDDLEG